MKQFLLNAFCAVGLVAGSVAVAQADPVLLSTDSTAPLELEAGVEYYMPAMQVGYGVYTVPQDMTVIVNVYNSNDVEFFNEDFNQNVNTMSWLSSTFNPYVYKSKTELAAGTKLYIRINWAFDSVKFVIEGAEKKAPGIVFTSPAEGDKVSISNSANYNLTVKFTDEVLTDAQCTLTVNGETTYTTTAQMDGYVNVTAYLKDALNLLYEKANVQDGDALQIKLTNVRSKDNPELLYNGDGVLIINCTLYAKPIELVKGPWQLAGGSLPEFLSYYMPGDERGIFVWEFESDLMPKGENQTGYLALSVGDLSYENKSKYEKIDYKIEGNKVVADVTGELRNSIGDSSSWLEAFNSGGMSIQLKALKAADGQFVACNSTSAAGSFEYLVDKFTVVNANIVLDIQDTPQGTSIKKGDRIEWYLMNYKDIKFDGVEFIYEANATRADEADIRTIFIPLDEIDIVEDDYDPTSAYVYFNVPYLRGCQQGTEITVRLANPVTADGYDHSANLQTTYVAEESTGISEILGGAEALVDVYRIDGTLVARGIQASEIANRLPAGLYIAGGKKVIVK